MIRLLFSYFVLFSTIELYIPEPEAPQLVYMAIGTQLIGRLFSPSQKMKKLTHPFRLRFELGLGTHVYHAKY